MRHARIIDGAVLEILQPPSGYKLEDCYHADIVKTCVACTEDVQIGWTYSPEQGFVSPDQGVTDGQQVDSGSNQETGGTGGQEDTV